MKDLRRVDMEDVLVVRVDVGRLVKEYVREHVDLEYDVELLPLPHDAAVEEGDVDGVLEVRRVVEGSLWRWRG